MNFKHNKAKILSRDGHLIAEAYEQAGIFLLKVDETDGNTMMVQIKDKEKDTVKINNNKIDKIENNFIKNTDVDANVKLDCKPYLGRGGKDSDKRLWHRRLGHVCEKYLNYMPDNELVRDLNYTREPLGSCEPCIMGKMSQKPNYSIKEMRTREPLELVHMDLCGPMPVESVNGSRYFYVLVDEYSKYVCVYIVRTKDEAFQKFVHYMNKPAR